MACDPGKGVHGSGHAPGGWPRDRKQVVERRLSSNKKSKTLAMDRILHGLAIIQDFWDDLEPES